MGSQLKERRPPSTPCRPRQESGNKPAHSQDLSLDPLHLPTCTATLSHHSFVLPSEREVLSAVLFGCPALELPSAMKTHFSHLQLGAAVCWSEPQDTCTPPQGPSPSPGCWIGGVCGVMGSDQSSAHFPPRIPRTSYNTLEPHWGGHTHSDDPASMSLQGQGPRHRFFSSLWDHIHLVLD